MSMAEALTRAGYKSTPEKRMTLVECEALNAADDEAWAPEEWVEQAKMEATHAG